MCEAYTQVEFHLVDRADDDEIRFGQAVHNAWLQCTSCKRIVGGVVDAYSAKKVVDYWPHYVSGKDFPDVPVGIASAADEAHRCLSIGANRAAIAMARAVVEATAKYHKITKGSLEAKIDAMASKGIIGQDTKKAAHVVRLWGNDAAHGDLAEESVEQADAEEILVLMDDVLERAYQAPARVARVTASREARRLGGQGGVADASTT